VHYGPLPAAVIHDSIFQKHNVIQLWDKDPGRCTLLLKPSRLRSRSALLVLVVAMVLTATQFSLYAVAQEIEDRYDCSPPWDIITVRTGKNLDVQYRCEPRMYEEDLRVWRWVFYRFVPAGGDKRVTAFRKSTSPPYAMEIQGLFGEAQGGGGAGSRIYITQPNGGNLDRRIAARVIMEVSNSPTGGWYNCAGHDTGWVEASQPQSVMTAFLNNYTQPDCGVGYYRAQVAGRFWSVSLNRWITSQWHYTGAVWVNGPPCCVAATEPTSIRVPPITGDP
jgi:hypothetical protein